MDLTLSDPLWKRGTSTVGLLVTHVDRRLNVMSAEWSYFVAKDPMMVAVLIHESNWTAERVAHVDEFTLTFCSQSQAHIADFCGSFSAHDLDKGSSDALQFLESDSVSVPWIPGGVMALECTTHQRVALPHYTMVIGNVVGVHGKQESPPPLVKHDAMFALGERVPRSSVVVGTHWPDEGILIGAVASPEVSSDKPYDVSLIDEENSLLHQTSAEANEYGDLEIAIRLPEEVASRVRRVCVSRDGLEPGFASVSKQRNRRH